MTDLRKFIISNTQYIKIIPDQFTKNDCEVCNKSKIKYIDEEKNININIDYMESSTFCYFIGESGIIQDLIDGKLILNKKITPDLGFEWNESFHDSKKPTQGSKYHAFSNSHLKIKPYLSCWLYNDKDGNVIFEITPFYPWHGENKKSNPDFITYKQFMKNYKPVLKTTIPKENLKQWITQALKLKKSLGINND